MNLQGHAKAGAEVIAKKLGQQMAAPAIRRDVEIQRDMDRVQLLFRGSAIRCRSRAGNRVPPRTARWRS